MQPQISSFRGQLAECCASAILYSLMLAVLPLFYFLGLRLSLELTILLTLILYVKIRKLLVGFSCAAAARKDPAVLPAAADVRASLLY